MLYIVEVRAVSNSIHALYTKEWESPSVDPCVFDTEEDARQFYRDCVEFELDSRMHAYGIRREGEKHHFLTWNI